MCNTEKEVDSSKDCENFEWTHRHIIYMEGGAVLVCTISWNNAQRKTPRRIGHGLEKEGQGWMYGVRAARRGTKRTRMRSSFSLLKLLLLLLLHKGNTKVAGGLVKLKLPPCVG